MEIFIKQIFPHIPRDNVVKDKTSGLNMQAFLCLVSSYRLPSFPVEIKFICVNNPRQRGLSLT